jgi:hypothetical protein
MVAGSSRRHRDCVGFRNRGRRPAGSYKAVVMFGAVPIASDCSTASNVRAALQRAQSTLLTKCLCGRDKRRAGAARLHVCAPRAIARPPLLGSRHAQKASIVAISRAFRGPVNRVNSFP